MKKGHLVQTWQEKFAFLEVGEEYLYRYQNQEQIEKVKAAVKAENRKKGVLILLEIKRKTFLIKKIIVPQDGRKNQSKQR